VFCIAASLFVLAGGTARAADTGPSYSWSASVQGPALHGRGMRTTSPPILPNYRPPQAAGVVTAVRWHYTFAGLIPPDLQAYLCNSVRCVMLPDAQGSTDAFRGDDAGQGFVFAFMVPGRGALTPVLQGRSDQVIVNFR